MAHHFFKFYIKEHPVVLKRFHLDYRGFPEWCKLNERFRQQSAFAVIRAKANHRLPPSHLLILINEKT